MKHLLHIVIASLFLFLLSGCPENPTGGTGIRRYPVTENIINPPDSFLVLMPLSNNNSVKTFLRTESNAVWKVSKDNATSSLVWMVRSENNTELRYLQANDTIGIQADLMYEIYGNNNNYPEDRILQLRFEKTPIDYHTFPGKI